MATLLVNDEGQLDHESKPEWNLILKATDVYGNSGSTGVKVTLSDEVEWGSTGVFVVSWEVEDPVFGVGTGDHHAEILIIPEDQETYGGNGPFVRKVWVDRQEMFYTTVGAGPGASGLVSETNRSGIDEDEWTQRGTVVTSGSTNDMIDLIFNLDGQYGDNLQYWFFPENTPADDWNSNSYAHGLLNALEASDSDIDAPPFNPGAQDFPGWPTPVPLTAFGIEDEE